MLIGIYAYCRRGQLSIIIVYHTHSAATVYNTQRVRCVCVCVCERKRERALYIVNRTETAVPGRGRGEVGVGGGYDFTMRLRFDCNCLVCAAVTPSVRRRQSPFGRFRSQINDIGRRRRLATTNARA